MVVKRVLSLDGGGVRGISSLLILRELLRLVSRELKDGPDPMLPLHVFNIIVGTSTGGYVDIIFLSLIPNCSYFALCAWTSLKPLAV
jgi:patatin-like phospholipase/acyl hydrolase